MIFDVDAVGTAKGQDSVLVNISIMNKAVFSGMITYSSWAVLCLGQPLKIGHSNRKEVLKILTSVEARFDASPAPYEAANIGKWVGSLS